MSPRRCKWRWRSTDQRVWVARLEPRSPARQARQQTLPDYGAAAVDRVSLKNQSAPARSVETRKWRGAPTRENRSPKTSIGFQHSRPYRSFLQMWRSLIHRQNSSKCFMAKYSATGPNTNAGTKVRAPTTKIVPSQNPPKSKVSVRNVPAVTAAVGLAATEPATAIIKMIGG